MDYCNGCLYPTTHIVTCGDTLYRIAETYGTTVECILQKNPGVAALNLIIGTVLNICRNSATGSGGCGGCSGCGGYGCNCGCGCGCN